MEELGQVPGDNESDKDKRSYGRRTGWETQGRASDRRQRPLLQRHCHPSDAGPGGGAQEGPSVLLTGGSQACSEVALQQLGGPAQVIVSDVFCWP